MCILYNQRDATYTIFFITISVLHVSGGFSAHHRELIKLNVQPWVVSCFPAVYRWYGWVGTVPTHPHQRKTLGKHDNTQGCTYIFISS